MHLYSCDGGQARSLPLMQDVLQNRFPGRLRNRQTRQP